MREGDVDELLRILRRSVLGAPVRLAIMIYLISRGKMYFSDLLRALDVTLGNLWSHLRKLEEEGMVVARRVFTRRPRVQVEITEKGINETMSYIRTIKRVLEGITEEKQLKIKDKP